jgi:hypothetical protein
MFYFLVLGLIVLFVALLAAFIFSVRFARSIEDPLGMLAKLLNLIDYSYLQDSTPISQMRLESF